MTIFNFIKILPLISVSLFFTISNAIAQDQVYKSSFTKDQIINVGAEMKDGSILFAGSNYDTTTDILTSALYVYSPFNNEVTAYEFLNEQPIELLNSDIVELKQAKNGDVLILFNSYFQLEDRFNTDGTFGIMRISNDYSKEDHLVFKRPNYRSLFLQNIVILSENDASNFIVAGSQRTDYTFADFWYFAEVDGDSLVSESISYGDFAESYFNQYFFKTDTIFNIARFGGPKVSTTFFNSKLDSMNNFDFTLSEYFSLPFSTKASADRDGNSTPSYANGLNRIHVLSDSVWVSDSFYNRTWLKISGNNVIDFDTTTIGMYYFSSSLDSIKFVDLSNQYIIDKGSKIDLFSYYSDSKISKDSSKFCFSGVINQHLYESRPNKGYSSGILAMLDDTGKVLWNYQIAEEVTHIRLTTTVAKSDGGCVFIGDYFKDDETDGRDIIVVELDSLGTLTSISDKSLAHLFDQQKIAAYPNPAKSNGTINLSWSGINKQNWQLQLYSSQGQLVHSTNITQAQKEVQLQLPQLLKGNYILRATGSNKQVHTGTVVVE